MPGGTRRTEFDYQLGLDLGTTYSSAAVVRGLRAEMIVLGHRSPLLPSAVWLGPGGEVLVGEAARRRGQLAPEGLVREFKRRLGDRVPFMVRGRPVSAAMLTTILTASLVEQVIAVEGREPTRVAVTHPANWGPYRRDLFREAVRSAGVSDPLLLSEPEAAALYYASAGRVGDGEIVVVYDLGGGTFDVAILQRRGDQFTFRGHPDGVERLGGIDFDELVFDYVRDAVGGLEADATDETWSAAVRRLHDDCVEAKEALSADVVVEIPVMLPARHTSIRLPRREFEELIRPSVGLTIEAVQRALASAQLDPDDIARVLLVGGSSRIPLVAEQISSRLRWSVAVDAHPKFAVVLGAAMAAASDGVIDERVTLGAPAREPARSPDLTPPAPEGGDVDETTVTPEGGDVDETTVTPEGGDVDETTVTPAAATRSRRSGRRRSLALVVAAVAAVAALSALLLVWNGSNGPSAPSGTRAGSTTLPTEPVRVALPSAPAGLAKGLGAAWAATADGQLVEVDAEAHAVRRTVTLAASLDDVAIGATDVWVTGADALYRVAPTDPAAAERIAMPGRPDGIAVSEGTVWLALVAPVGGALYRVDERTGAASEVATFPLAVTEVFVDGSVLWVSSSGSSVYRVDPSTGRYTDIDVGGATQGILVAGGELWATLPLTNEVAWFDRADGRRLGQIATAPAPNEIILGGGVIWVSEEGGGSVVAIDPASHQIARRLAVGAGPDRMVWSEPNLWVANAGEGSLSIVTT